MGSFLGLPRPRPRPRPRVGGGIGTGGGGGGVGVEGFAGRKAWGGRRNRNGTETGWGDVLLTRWVGAVAPTRHGHARVSRARSRGGGPPPRLRTGPAGSDARTCAEERGGGFLQRRGLFEPTVWFFFFFFPVGTRLRSALFESPRGCRGENLKLEPVRKRKSYTVCCYCGIVATLAGLIFV